mmetsp:Transcript_145/g.637  ORF Transcript_145/g.637 Transcript_145/m.637 type:complete len:401 (-) Transcript_145:162-1364(-)
MPRQVVSIYGRALPGGRSANHQRGPFVRSRSRRRGHFCEPRGDVRTNQSEAPLERGNYLFLAVVLRMQPEAAAAFDELARREHHVDEPRARLSVRHDVPHALAVFGLAPRILRESLTRHERSGRKLTAIRRGVGPKPNLLCKDKLSNRHSTRENLAELRLHVPLDQAQVLGGKQKPQRGSHDLHHRRTRVSAHSLDSLRIKRWHSLRRRLKHVTDVAFLRDQHARRVHLLELQHHGRRVLGGDRRGDFLTDDVRLFDCPTRHVHKQRVSVAVHHPRAPTRVGVHRLDGALQSLPTTLHDGISELSHGHPARESCRRVPVCDVGDELETKLTRVQCPAARALVGGCSLQRLLDHHTRVQNFCEEPRQDTGSSRVRCKHDAVGCTCHSERSLRSVAVDERWE